MRHSYLIGISMALMLSACANANVTTASSGGQQVVESQSDEAVVAAVAANLRDGATVETATQKQLNKAIKRTIQNNPEMKGSLVPALTKVAPGRAAMFKKAVSTAMAPYSRPNGNGRGGTGGGSMR